MRLIAIRLQKAADIARVRQVGQLVTDALGFDRFSQTRIVTAMVELARNTITHGGGGRLALDLTEDSGCVVLGVRVSDSGPGIPNAERILQMVRTKQNGNSHSGLGLPGVGRMADGFDITSGANGSAVSATFQTGMNAQKFSALAQTISERLLKLGDADPSTALAQQNDELMRALEERDLLIQEVHHRTRNNLTLINSLVQMSQRSAKHPEAASALAELKVRLHALLTIHQQLERAQSNREIDLLAFLRSVASNAQDAFSAQSSNVSITVEGASPSLPGDVTADIGLMVGELITNAFKHAFVDRPDGTIAIGVDCRSAEYLCLVVADNGVGLPDGVDRPERSKSIGWRMIRTMAARHGGEITVAADDGVRVEISLRDIVVDSLDLANE